MFLILQKEYVERVKKRSFILLTLLTPLLIFSIAFAPTAVAHFTKDSSSKVLNVAVIDETGKIATQFNSNNSILFNVILPSDINKAKQDKSHDAFLHIGKDAVTNYNNIKLESFNEVSIKNIGNINYNLNNAIKNIKIENYNIDNLPKIIQDLNTRISVQTMTITQEGSTKESSTALNYFSGLTGGLFMYMLIFIYGAMVLQSVIEEKNTKVVEIMVSTISPTHLLLGKIMGIGLVAITQFAIWGITTYIGGTLVSTLLTTDVDTMHMIIGESATAMATSGLSSELSMILDITTNIGTLLKTLSLFALYFIGGYLFYASLFAAAASAVDSMQEVQQFQMPISMPIIASIILLPSVLANPESSISFWLSIIPFTSPVIMMARISNSTPIWEILMSLFVLYTSFIGVLWIAGRIYRVGIFMHGKKITYKQLYKWIRS